ncbi:MAG: Asp-tRNA(Asn)/Glu-tRNA(Gln) amidotransferase subunit GatC [Candidatus Helarchaeota archaeon]
MTTLITKEQVEHIAWLARIKLSEEEKEEYTNLFNEILKYFHEINEVDTIGIEMTSHAVQLKNIMREDKVRPSLPIEDVLKNAPKTEKTFIKAPRMT